MSAKGTSFWESSRGMLSQENVMDFNSLKSPYLGV